MTTALRLPLEAVPLAAPPAMPIDMPDQRLDRAFRDPAAPGAATAPVTRAVRLLALATPQAVTLALGWLSWGWFALDGQVTWTEGALIGVTVFAFYWVVLSVVTALLGLMFRARPAPAGPLRPLDIAILLPMYGEPARATIGPAVTLLSALQAGPPGHRYSLHVLSDTRDPDAAALEAEVVQAIRRARPDLAVSHRHRDRNADYKSGNIRDWVMAQGHLHAAMLVLDADSVMGAATVRRMADEMAADPGCGLIQTVTRVAPGTTLWQGMQSLASEVYGRNLGRGFALWTGAEGNFMGHNALVRIAAFAACAGLPHLPGRAPRGGVILSHDFVEAALLRRAGWGVRMLPEAAESFEDTPETLIGYLRRDRRWCQGNMQHLRLLAMPGLHPVSRFHLLQGAMAYLASVWWLVFLVLWALPMAPGGLPDFWGDNPLMPVWPDLPPVTQGSLAAFVGMMLLGPKALGLAAHIREHGVPRGRRLAFARAILVEVVLSVLMAPILMLHQVRAVLRTLSGFDGGWMPHLAGRPTPAMLVRFHATETVLGAALLAAVATGMVTAWLLPVAVSLSLAVPLSWLVQREVAPGGRFVPAGAAA